MCLHPISAASSALSNSSCPRRGKPTPVRSPAPSTAPGPPPRGAGLRGQAAAALPFLEGAIPINFSGRTGPAAQSRTGFPSPYSASRARPALAAAQHSPSPAPTAAAGPAGTASPRGLRRERCRAMPCFTPVVPSSGHARLQRCSVPACGGCRAHTRASVLPRQV